jgi:hypothetical protein
MAGLRRVFDHPRILAHDPSVCGAMENVEPLAIHRTVARVDGDLDRCRAGDASLAMRLALSRELDLDSRHCAAFLRIVHLFAIGKKFQRATTRRPAGSEPRRCRPASGDRWNSITHTASGVPRASVRDARLERWDRTRSLLGVDRARSGHGSSDDPNGGCGIGEKIWSRIPHLSQNRPRSGAASLVTAQAIIRSD